jgi:hypothetical protein
VPDHAQLLIGCPAGSFVAGTGEASLALVRDQLSNKAAAHEVLLMALGAGGVMQQLSAAEQQELREHAEMTAAVLRVLDAWLQQEAAARDAAGQGEDGKPPTTTPVQCHCNCSPGSCFVASTPAACTAAIHSTQAG